MSNISEYGTLTKAPMTDTYKLWRRGDAELRFKLAAAVEVLTRIHNATNIVHLGEAMRLAGLCLKEIEK